MDVRSFFVALLGVAVAGASAYGAREYMNGQTATAAAIAADPASELVTIVVATQNIGFGQPIEAQMLRYQKWPRAALPIGAFTDVSKLIAAVDGQPRRTKYALAAGDLILPDMATQTHWRNLPTDDQSRLSPPTLILPHPRIQDRAFVLVPLADIAPDWRHPVLGLTVTQMLSRLDLEDIAAVTPLQGC